MTEDNHPESERPRMDVDVVETKASAEAEAVTRPIVGEEHDKRTGEVSVKVRVVVECCCGEEVTIHTIQPSVMCSGCGRRWKM